MFRVTFVLVNSSPTKEFLPKKGLRPISSIIVSYSGRKFSGSV